MIDEPISPDVMTAIQDLIRQDMGRYGLREVSIRASTDHDGDPVLRIDASYDPVDEPIDPNDVSELLSRLRDRLWAMNERRFPHIRHHFSEQQKVVGYS